MTIRSLVFGAFVFASGCTETSDSELSSSDVHETAQTPQLSLHSPHWENTAPLAAARESHTATLLRTGQVLVAGGSNGSALSTAELYDARRDRWSGTGSLKVARSAHTATLLRNGDVLVVGGRVGDDAVSSAEIYNARTGTWTVVGSLIEGRSEHIATLLDSGKVLVAGGFSGVGLLKTAEIFDPATRTWRSTGSMSIERFAVDPAGGGVELCDGRVMWVGGDDRGSGEIYNLRTETWSTTAPLPFPIATHSVTRLRNCEVLVAGGQKLGVPFEDIGTLETRTYNPRTNVWTRAGDLHEFRYYFQSTIVNSGNVVIVGGSGVTADPINAEVFDPSTRRWTVIPGPQTFRVFATFTRLRTGEVLLAGGSFLDYESSAEVLNLH